MNVAKAQTEKDFLQAREVLISAFSKPTPYKLFVWVSAKVNGDVAKCTEQFVAWFSDLTLRETKRSNGFTLLVKDDNGLVLGSCTVGFRGRDKYFNPGIFSVIGNGLPPSLRWGAVNAESWKRFKELGRLDDERYKAVLQNQAENHFYLMQLATIPEARGKGVADLMLKTIFKESDALNIPVYLETDEPDLNKFYMKRGFKTEGQYTLLGSENFEPNFAMVRWPKMATNEE